MAHPLRWRRLVGLALLAALAPTTAAPARTRSLSLSTESDAVIKGGFRIAPAGDVNGDRVPDLLISARGPNDPVRPGAGAVYAVFGPLDEGDEIELDSLGDRGFRIDGAMPGDAAINAIGLGDVNGDALDDVLIGAPQADNNLRNLSGSAYVVFGKMTNEPVDLLTFNLNVQLDKGFRIDGAYGFDLLGEDVGAGEDINGDGLADLLLGAPFAGATYVIFGKGDSLPIDLRTFHDGTQGNAGYLIMTPAPNRSDNYSVAGGGDVNRDGVPDVVIGVIRKRVSPGTVYVVFGKRNVKPLDVEDLGHQGFAIQGPRAFSFAGYAVATIDDLNGDHRDEVLVGAYQAGHKPTFGGAVCVVFGKASPSSVRLRDLDESKRGYSIIGRGSDRFGEGAGYSLAVAGDVNGDGVSDIIIGAPYADYHHKENSGSAYVVFGKGLTASVRLADLQHLGFRMDGSKGQTKEDCDNVSCIGDHAGASVAGVGDVNGDGLDDVAVSAPYAEVDSSDEGLIYIVLADP